MNWLYYLAEANIYLGVFYLAHCLFLNRNTHYQLSRAYLIFSCIISFILPVLQVGVLRPVKPTEVANIITPVMPSAVSIAEPYQAPVINTIPAPAVIDRQINMQDVLWY